jgi:methylisocitrate lyase
MCGHFEGKRVVPVEEMLQRLEAAQAARVSSETMIVARTDAASPLGMDEAIRRARIYGEAGADALFVEAPTSRDDLARIGQELGDWPLVANMVEFGKTPLLPADELGDLGFSIVIHPGAISRTITKAAREMLTELKSSGTTSNHLGYMESFAQVNEVVALGQHRAWEESVASVRRPS